MNPINVDRLDSEMQSGFDAEENGPFEEPEEEIDFDL